MIDSGSSKSFITRDSLNRLTQISETNRVNITAVTANNTTIRINETINLPVLLPRGCTKTDLEFLIIEEVVDILNYDAILGIDSIKKLNITLTKQNEIYCALTKYGLIGKEEFSHTNQLFSIKIKELAQQIITEFKDIFEEKITTMMYVEPMSIELVSNYMPKARMRRHSPEDRDEIITQIDRLCKYGIIEPCKSEFSSNCHLVPKKTGQKRMVINFIPLNRITKQDHYPMPRLQDLFSVLRNARHFTALDCTEGFFQIAIKESDRHKTAFVTPIGLYQFNRCPFGFVNSPGIYQRAMDTIFKDKLYKWLVVYVDDILIFAETIDQLIERMRWTFNQCRKYCVKLKESKCNFIVEKVTFLGFEISHNRIGPVEGKFDPILNKIPATKKDVQSLLGTLNYYGRFIKNLSERVKPLRDLIKGDNEIIWSYREQTILESIRNDLQNATWQTIPDSNTHKTIDILIHENSIEITCFDADETLISRTGKTLSTSEANYTTAEKNLLAMQLAYDSFGTFMRNKVTFKGDLKQLKKVMSLKERPERIERIMLRLPADANFELLAIESVMEPQDSLISDDPPDEIYYTDGACMANGNTNCQASWAILAINNKHLSTSGRVIGYKNSNQIAELYAALKAIEISLEHGMKRILLVTDSRYVIGVLSKWMPRWKSNNWRNNRNKSITNIDIIKKLSELLDKLEVKTKHVKGHSSDEYNQKVDEMARRVLTTEVVTINAIITNEWNQYPEVIELMSKSDQANSNYIVKDNQLYFVDESLPAHYRNRLYVPVIHRQELMKRAHDDPLHGGHYGVKKTRMKLREYYWPSIATNIADYVQSCHICQTHKRSYYAKLGYLNPIPVSNLFERLHMDIVGPLPESKNGNKLILTCIDALSRYAFAAAKPVISTRDIIEFINYEIISKHGKPAQITTDNGTQFTSKSFHDYITKLDIKHSRTCDYHPAANGMDERFNATICKIIRNYIDKSCRSWDDQLQWALLAYNTTIHSSTGLTPYSVLFGRKPRTSVPSISGAELEPQHRVLRKHAIKATRDSQIRQKSYHDLKCRPVNIEINDFVYIREHERLTNKMKTKWSGPHMVSHIKKGENDQPIALEVLDLVDLSHRLVAFNNIKEAYVNNEVSSEPTPGELITKYIIIDDEEDDENRVNSDYSPLDELLLDLSGENISLE